MIAILGPLILTTITILLFFGFLFGIYHFLRWLWARLPNIVQANQLDKTLGFLLSLVFFPNLTSFAWGIFQALVNYIPDVIKAIWVFPRPNGCTSAGCVSDLSAILAKSFGFASANLVATLRLTEFPAAHFVWFLLIAVIATQVIGSVYQAATITRIKWWYEAVRAVIPAATFWRRLAFPVLVLVSFYLGLCALLAIALFQDKSRSEFTVEALGKALDANINIIKPELFDETFSALRDPTLPKLPGPNANEDATMLASFNIDIQIREQTWQDLQSAWSSLLTTAKDFPLESREQAIKAFAAGLDVSAGKKQSALHYNNLFL